MVKVRYGVADYPLTRIDTLTYRIVASRYPAISLYDRVASQAQFDVLYAVESLTNNRLRDELGIVEMVNPEDRVYGPGATFIMASFTHPPVNGMGGRFNRDFGVYYCAKQRDVAVSESCYHRSKLLREAGFARETLDMRVIRAYLGPVTLTDITAVDDGRLYDSNNYTAGHQLGTALHAANSYGLTYRSVRADGVCFGVFRPLALTNALHWAYLRFHYEDGAITRVDEINGEAGTD
ncbi:MAG: RES family NAD+ phosphorylase [Pseudomonadales bacterium]